MIIGNTGFDAAGCLMDPRTSGLKTEDLITERNCGDRLHDFPIADSVLLSCSINPRRQMGRGRGRRD